MNIIDSLYENNELDLWHGEWQRNRIETLMEA